MRARAAVCAIVLSMMMASCGGHGGGSAMLPPSAPTHPIAQHEQVKFSFLVPAKTVSAARRAETISPSTQSIGVTVNAGTEQVFDALPTSPGCSPGETGTTCTVTIDAAVGNDAFVVNAYSGTGATGQILDRTTFNYTIVLDTTNTIAITLGPVVSTTADSGPGSLRQALEDANAGDTVTFLLDSPSTIMLTSGVVPIAKNVTLSGPSGGSITISGNNASRIFTVLAGVTATISHLTLTQGDAATGNGGALDTAGALTLDTVTITNSSASGPDAFGGAVAGDDGASLAISNSTITGNRATQGGGIFESARMVGRVTISDSTLSNNMATDTQGYDDGGALVANVATTLTNDAVSGNTGSAIVANAPLTISGGTYSGNSAAGNGANNGGYGGALYVFNAVQISNAKFDGNMAGDPNVVASPPTSYGGAIYSDDDVTIDNTTFSNNLAGSGLGATGQGGAINMADGILTVTNSTFTSNSAGGTNAATGYGGAVFDETHNQISISSSSFTLNSAGGADEGFGGALALVGQFTIDRNTFTQNSVYGSNDGDAAGGAAYVGSTGSTDRFTNSTFTSNSATGGATTGGSNGFALGGGLYVDGGTLTLDGDQFTSNTVTAAHDAEGGGLEAEGTIAMNGGSFDANTVTVGDGGCMAASVGGGAVFSDAGVSNVSFTNNKALITSPTSSGICALARPHAATVKVFSRRPSSHNRHQFTFVRRRGQIVRRPHVARFLTRTVYGLGGAIGVCSCSTTFTFSNGTVSGNTAATDGGGMYLNGDTAVITNSSITSNAVTATPNTDDGGGGLMIAGTTSTTITGSTIANNSVAGDQTGNDGGGGLFITQPTTMTNDTITGNSAQFGGDIYNELSSLTLTNVTVMNGTANADGGAGGDYYGQSSNSLTLFGSIIAGGSAPAQDNLGGDTQMTTITDNGYNVVNTSNSSMAPGSDYDVIGATVDPLLSALAANGGPTQTMADSASSPGKDLIPLTTCTANGVTTDQRGNTRGDVGDNKCDAGAYEFP